MKRFLLPLLLPTLLLTACDPATPDRSEASSDTSARGTAQPEARWETREDFGTFFREAGFDGSFILHNVRTNTFLYYDSLRCITRFSPASTFKVFNALVGLETKAIADENEIIPWDGVRRSWNEWNRDHTLRSGMKYSVVWYYQELARRIGRERMQAYLDSVDYGNRTIGDDVDKFWLDGSLQISPFEEASFMERLAMGDLPFSERSMRIVRDITTLDSTDTYVLHGKTGLGRKENGMNGWLAGYLERGDSIYSFALNMDLDTTKTAKLREEITRRIFRRLGLM